MIRYVESENSPTKDPLIVWLGDGPGCSALYNILAGNGPYLVKENGFDLDYNDNSWNKVIIISILLLSFTDKG